MLGVTKFLDEKLICFLDSEDRDGALTCMVDMLDQNGNLDDREAFFQAILDREKLVSTGIGMGVAIPHAKLPVYDDFFIAIGIQKGKGLDWNAMDGTTVQLIFLVGGPDDKQTQYLQILSQLTMAVKDEDRRQALLQVESPEDVLGLFRDL
ncbi:hypothetical protein SCG7109_AA_00120 [Chlamydiales bacterium SCGC AG-110-M15]|nr:hypothetical protein SCG7109_AA_00120 [Chlamydiales bacterium SCGC AG-110-M15]